MCIRDRLFVVDVFLAGTAFVLAHVLKVTIGFTFSCGLIDFLVFGVLQGNSKTHWVFIIAVSYTHLLEKVLL